MIIGLENHLFVFLRVAALHSFYCNNTITTSPAHLTILPFIFLNVVLAKALALLLLNHCFLLLPLFVGVLCVFFFVLMCSAKCVSSFAITLVRKRACCFNCLPTVLVLVGLCSSSSRLRGLLCSL